MAQISARRAGLAAMAALVRLLPDCVDMLTSAASIPVLAVNGGRRPLHDSGTRSKYICAASARGIARGRVAAFMGPQVPRFQFRHGASEPAGRIRAPPPKRSENAPGRRRVKPLAVHFFESGRRPVLFRSRILPE
jgi:hypothetical protein